MIPAADRAARTPVVDLLDRFGPGSTERVALHDARRYARALSRRHKENFVVMSVAVPRDLRDHLAALYAFCRWSDDLADETGSGPAARDRSRELLAWWRQQLHACFDGSRTHPVFVALGATADEKGLSREPFDRLIDAFERDQHQTRYETLDDLMTYCARSADPVGRVVLALCGLGDGSSASGPAGAHEKSDAVCSALQLVNFWQDVRRDLLDRDRVYLPAAESALRDEDLRAMLADPSPEHRQRFSTALTPLLERTGELFERGLGLGDLVAGAGRPDAAPMIEAFAAYGREVLHAIDRGGRATLWRRPTVPAGRRLGVLLSCIGARSKARPAPACSGAAS